MFMVVVGWPGAIFTQASTQYCEPLHILPVMLCVGPLKFAVRPVTRRLHAPVCASFIVGVNTTGAPPPRETQPWAVPSSQLLEKPELSGGTEQPAAGTLTMLKSST